MRSGVIFADGPTVPDTVYCFSCTVRYAGQELASCVGCSRPWPFVADVEDSIAVLCPECRKAD